MRPFAYQTAASAPDAVQAAVVAGAGASDRRGDGAAVYLAGGTTLLDLMKLDVMRPSTLVDLQALQLRHGEIEATPSGLRIGALAHMSAVADNAAVRRDYRVVAESLQLAASAQLRNMATIGGNVLQRTRCSYFRDTSYTECNKREPGSGCAALKGMNRTHAVLGVTDRCIASYPGDFAQAAIALSAAVEILGPDGPRTIPFAELHLRRADTPHVETSLRPGELITAVFIPAGPHTRRSTYVKVRDRQSYAFAIASAAVALDLGPDGVVRDVRIGLGGVHYAPYRATAGEAALRGQRLDETTAIRAAQESMRGAVTHGHNGYKPELARRTLVRALLQARDLRVEEGRV